MINGIVGMNLEDKSRVTLRQDVNAGIVQLDAGKGVDGHEVFARLEDRATLMANSFMPRGSAKLKVQREDILSPVADQLICALNKELDDRYPEEGANHFDLDAEEVLAGRGAFLVAFLDGEPVGCGAVRRIAPTVCEIKRMYVVPGARGRGVGRRILNELESIARTLGAARLVLETGVRQPEAIALYTNAGFTTIPLFGSYADTPRPELSVCMAKDLL